MPFQISKTAGKILAVDFEDVRNEMTMLLPEAQHLKGTVPH